MGLIEEIMIAEMDMIVETGTTGTVEMGTIAGTDMIEGMTTIGIVGTGLIDVMVMVGIDVVATTVMVETVDMEETVGGVTRGALLIGKEVRLRSKKVSQQLHPLMTDITAQGLSLKTVLRVFHLSRTQQGLHGVIRLI